MNRNKRFVMFAGTTEGRLLARYFWNMGCSGLICTATEYGGQLLAKELSEETESEKDKAEGTGIQVICGRLDQQEIEGILERESPSLVVDATHPYAVQITENLRQACGNRKIRLLRCLREPSVSQEEGVYFPDIERAVSWLEKTEGAILVTTGSKELALFKRLPDFAKRVYARVLPMEESIGVCRSLGLKGRHIIAMQGPFSEEMNLVQLQEYGCAFLVTKDGGKAGGFEEKERAAKRAGARLLIIRRPHETGHSLEEVKRLIKEWISHEKQEP